MVEGALIHWRPQMNMTRQMPHMGKHRVNGSLSLTTPDYGLHIYSVDLVPACAQNFTAQSLWDATISFIDLDLQRLKMDGGECMEGAWGRTSCHSSQEVFDPELYNIHGELFSTDFPFNLFKTDLD